MLGKYDIASTCSTRSLDILFIPNSLTFLCFVLLCGSLEVTVQFTVLQLHKMSLLYMARLHTHNYKVEHSKNKPYRGKLTHFIFIVHITKYLVSTITITAIKIRKKQKQKL